MTVLTKEHVTGELPCKELPGWRHIVNDKRACYKRATLLAVARRQNLSTCKALQQLCLATCCCRPEAGPEAY